MGERKMKTLFVFLFLVFNSIAFAEPFSGSKWDEIGAKRNEIRKKKTKKITAHLLVGFHLKKFQKDFKEGYTLLYQTHLDLKSEKKFPEDKNKVITIDDLKLENPKKIYVVLAVTRNTHSIDVIQNGKAIYTNNDYITMRAFKGSKEFKLRITAEYKDSLGVLIYEKK
jgi:hypothetical protein